jgi:hypothetical protein
MHWQTLCGQASRGRIVSAYLLRLGKPGSGLPLSLCAVYDNRADRFFIVLPPRIVASCPFLNDRLAQKGAVSQKRIGLRLQKTGSKAFLNQFCKPNPVQEGFLRHFAERKILQVRSVHHFSEQKLLQVRYFNHFSEPKIVKEGFRRHFGGTCKPNRCEACIGTAEGIAEWNETARQLLPEGARRRARAKITEGARRNGGF